MKIDSYTHKKKKSWYCL